MFRWIGRLAFPIFCYCLTVGLLYTHDVRKYLTRLGIFALVSQPFYILAFHPVGEFWANLTNWNIFFTLFLSLLGMYGLKERKWWLFALALFTVSWWNFDYSGTGIQLMLIFYLCRNRPAWARPSTSLSYLPALMNGWPEDPLCLTVGGLCIDWSIFAVFAAPPDLLRHALPHQDQPLVLLRLLSRPSGGHRPGGEYPVRQKGRVLC